MTDSLSATGPAGGTEPVDSTGPADPTAQLPRWLWPVARLAEHARPEDFGAAAGNIGRPSAVLILFGRRGGSDASEPSDPSNRPAADPVAADPVAAGADVLLIRRAAGLRAHAGQPAFPGGGAEPDDAGPEATALREATEETGLDPSGVRVIGTLPSLYVWPSGYRVTPVLGWWHTSSPVRAADETEVAAVHRVGLDELLAPENRFRVRHRSGYIGPAFDVAGMVVWGFTGGLLDRLIRLVGWERPWDPGRVRDLPDELPADRR